MKEKVKQFAIEQGYSDAAYLEKWRGYDVYEPIFSSGGDIAYIGPPLVILVKADEIRMSTVEESYTQMDESLGLH